MYDTLSKYLRRIGVEFECDQHKNAVGFKVDSPEGSWNCSVLLDNNPNGLGFYSTLPVSVPEKLRTKIALFLMYLNNDRVFGNFEIDLKTGQVHFKTYVDCEANPLSERSLGRTLLINVTTMQKHMPQIIDLINYA